MRTAALVSTALLVVTACSSPPPLRPPPRPPDDCARVADHLLSLMTDAAREAPVEELDRVRATFNRRCRQDGWSPKAQQCFLALAAKEEVDRCASLLTDAQRQALEHGGT